MTDRVNGLYVALDQDMRKDDVELIVNAIRALKHIIAVDKNVACHNSWIAYERARREFSDKIEKVFSEEYDFE